MARSLIHELYAHITYGINADDTYTIITFTVCPTRMSKLKTKNPQHFTQS